MEKDSNKNEPKRITKQSISVGLAVLFRYITQYKKQIVLLTAFVLFRVFDVVKIPSRRVQDLKGGFGVVLDDVLAGICVNLILRFALKMIQ